MFGFEKIKRKCKGKKIIKKKNIYIYIYKINIKLINYSDILLQTHFIYVYFFM